MSSSLPQSGFIRESSSIGCRHCTPPPPAVQSEAAAVRQSCQCEAALRNRAEPSALARHSVSGRFINTHTHTCKSLQRFSSVSQYRSSLHYLLQLLKWKSRHVFGIDVDEGMPQASQQSRVIGLIICCVSTSCSSLCVCVWVLGTEGVKKR